ncbi:MAG TPA: hypothetical protein VGV38_07485 [Pyrinomonadaceae bacterium]|nr:hypothetical protein [Pyrinomonadaceae bacterium]
MKKKKKGVKKHTVTANIQVLDLTKAGSSMDFTIRANRETIGRIIIGRGSLTWFGRRKQTGKRLTWSQFAELMDEHAYGD